MKLPYRFLANVPDGLTDTELVLWAIKQPDLHKWFAKALRSRTLVNRYGTMGRPGINEDLFIDAFREICPNKNCQEIRVEVIRQIQLKSKIATSSLIKVIERLEAKGILQTWKGPDTWSKVYVWCLPSVHEQKAPELTAQPKPAEAVVAPVAEGLNLDE